MLERAHHVHDRVDVADVAEEAVAEALALMRAANQAGDVHDLEMLGDAALDPEQIGDAVQARVGHRHDCDVRFDGRERILRRLGGRAAQRIEQRRLAGVRQADDPDLHRAASSARPIIVPTAAPAMTSEG